MKETYPRDWKEYKFGDIFDLSGSLSISRANLSDEGICYLHYGDIHKSSNSFIDVDKSYSNISKYNISLEEVDSKYLLKDGDIVFADASEDYEGIAKSITVVNKDNKPFISGLHTIVARDKNSSIDNSYKRYFLKDWNIRKQLMTLATGTSVLGISQPNLKKIKVFLPAIEEQIKIGGILSEWDKAIELKEKLIEQKKEQKKGLMQRLLTGSIRLSGFCEDWNTMYLEEICVNKGLVRGPFGGALKKEYFVPQGYKVYEQKNAIYKDANLGDYYINENKFLELKRFEVKQGDFIVSCSGTIGRIYKIPDDSPKGVINQALLKITIDKKLIDSEYFYQYFQWEHFQNKIIENTQGGAMQNLVGMDIFRKTKIAVPNLLEQNKIASILSILDKEIYLEEQDLIQKKEQKKALMQQLLTGKIRVKV